MAQGQASARAFTLIELMIVVAIVGILAVCAYAGYHKFVTSSHQTEANNVLTGIAGRQDNYSAATGTGYMNVSGKLGTGNPLVSTTLYPHCMSNQPVPGSFSVAWPNGQCAASCCPGGGDWIKLAVQVTAPTYYGFTTIAGAAGATPPVLPMSGATNMFANVSVAQPWYVATAVADTDGNGVFTTSMISSFDNQIHIDNDGE